jgi:hypothetical protein
MRRGRAESADVCDVHVTEYANVYLHLFGAVLLTEITAAAVVVMVVAVDTVVVVIAVNRHINTHTHAHILSHTRVSVCSVSACLCESRESEEENNNNNNNTDRQRLQYQRDGVSPCNVAVCVLRIKSTKTASSPIQTRTYTASAAGKKQAPTSVLTARLCSASAIKALRKRRFLAMHTSSTRGEGGSHGGD